jgi:hypothetical protein
MEPSSEYRIHRFASNVSKVYRIVTPPSLYKIAKNSNGQHFEIKGEKGFAIKVPLAACVRCKHFKNAKAETSFFFPIMVKEVVRAFSDFLCHGYADVSLEHVEQFGDFAESLGLLGFVSIIYSLLVIAEYLFVHCAFFRFRLRISILLIRPMVRQFTKILRKTKMETLLPVFRKTIIIVVQRSLVVLPVSVTLISVNRRHRRHLLRRHHRRRLHLRRHLRLRRQRLPELVDVHGLIRNRI